MVVGRTFSISFRVEKNSKSFMILKVYIGIEAEMFFRLDNVLLSVLTNLS